MIHEYRLIERIGSGRYGVCYLATVNQGSEPVVIKKFKPGIWRRNKAKNAYEAVMLSQIDHPAIPKLLGVIHRKRFYAFVLEYMPGDTVETMLFRHRRVFTNAEIAGIGSQLIRILAYLHACGIVHRDLRIPNVIVRDGKVSLIDFGLARWADPDRYRFDQDFSYLGDFLLYLHYSAYRRKRGKSRPWYEELELTPAQKHMYKRLLRLEEPYAAIDEVERDFTAAFACSI